MKIFSWNKVLESAKEKIRRGDSVFQQWNCQHCGTKQTMPDVNKFYVFGICEECGKTTDIKRNGMNFMTVVAITPVAKTDLPKLFEEMLRGKADD